MSLAYSDAESQTTQEKTQAENWFRSLRDSLCAEFEKIETEFDPNSTSKFERKNWNREGGGGGQMSIMRGKIFEKVGVNISTVFGKFSDEFSKQIPGTEENSEFFATGISLVAHMKSPLVPAAHFNTRFIVTGKKWFGGGGDLNPAIINDDDTNFFHNSLKDACDKHDLEYYPKFKQYCDDYFFIKHRNEHRGVGGIFYDYLNSNDFDNDFNFTKDVGKCFLQSFPAIVRQHMFKKWTDEQKEIQLIKRGRYAEFNLVYDRGTKFGLMTGGNTEAILMSLPPEAKWV